MGTTASSDCSGFEDLAKGCIYGAFCGDALGSFLEFESHVSDKQVEQAMKMPGGGPFQLGPGQITDDSELALCVGHGLVAGKGVLDLEEIAKFYGKWIQSNPFDIGFTTKSSLGKAYKQTTDVAEKVRKGAQTCANSESNGCLMRMTPLCVWASNLNEEDLITAVREEVKLTHANKTAQNACIVYAYTIQHLLNNKGDHERGYEKAKEMVDKLQDPQLKSWLNDVETETLLPLNKDIGWSRLALTYSLFCLKKNMSYTDAMRFLLKGGGDTDTNCCIVGGMLGALHGFQALPQDYVTKVNKFDPKVYKNNGRPSFLTPKDCLEKIITKLIALKPEKLKMKNNEV